MDIAKEIGNNIKFYRARKHMSISELADAVCKSRATMYKYEAGQIIMDINTLYDLADVLEVPVDHLLYQPPMDPKQAAPDTVPVFFADRSRFYAYIYDGRSKKVCESVIDLVNEDDADKPAGSLPALGLEARAPIPGAASFMLRMYMDVADLEHVQNCQHMYVGRMTHYGALTNMVFQNYNVPLEQYIISVPSPYIDGEEKWALAFGISAHPLMPTSTKMLLSKTPIKKDKPLGQRLMITKEDIRIMKLYNMLVVM